MPLEESQAAMEAGWYCWVTHTGWSHNCSLSLSHHASDCSWTRERPQRGQPFECLMRQVIEKDPSQGCCLGSYCAKQWRRTSQGTPLNESCQRLEKGSNRALSSSPMAAVLPSHLAPPDSPQSKQLCHCHTQSSQGQPQKQIPVDDPPAEVAINPQWTPREERVMKRIKNFSTSCTSCRLNTHDQYR